jgi:hypothetical protein
LRKKITTIGGDLKSRFPTMDVYSEYPDDLPKSGWAKTPKRITDIEKRHRDVVMLAVREAIKSRNLQANQLCAHGRAMPTAERARILREEFDAISLKRAYLIASSIGLEFDTVQRVA